MKESKEAIVLEIFQNISDRYDKSNDRISFGFQKKWKKYLIDEIVRNLPKDSKVLDLCCGTGDIGISLAKSSKNTHVTGADFSSNMIKVAKSKAKKLDNISFNIEDACELSFDDSTFDIVAISFGLRNTKNYQKVLTEIKRVLKNDGLILCLDSFVPDFFIVKPFYKIYFKYIMPILGGGIKEIKSYKWLYQSTKEFLKKDQLIDLYEKVGFSNIKSKSFMFGSCLLIEGQKINN